MQQEFPSSHNQLKVEILKVNHHREDSDWVAMTVRDTDNQNVFMAVGILGQIEAGDYLVMKGTWGTHKTFGRQFKIESAVQARPNTREGIIRYLSSGVFKGIGKKTSEKIVSYFGLETFKILDEDPMALKQVPKLGKKQINNMLRLWQEKKDFHEKNMFLHKHGIGGALGKRILRLYGDEVINVITKNPYTLIKDVRGVGFLIADRIGQSCGLELDHEQRIKEGILHLLMQAEDQGHCFLYSNQILEKAGPLLWPQFIDDDAYKKKIMIHLQHLELERRIIRLKHGEDHKQDCFYLADLYECEKGSIDLVLNRIKDQKENDQKSTDEITERINNWIEKFGEKRNIDLSDEQKEAVKEAVLSRIFVLTGGPGVGKTTTSNTIIHLFKAMGKHVVLAAPTGRAAQRMSEVSMQPAKTIHRLLEWSAEEREFKRNSHNHLSADVVIIDESSMVDIRLAYSLLQAIPSKAQVIFIGDVDQLPSVGPGNFLRDLIQCGKIPFRILSKIFRQAQQSLIIQSAHAINKGQIPKFTDQNQSDCRFIEVDSYEQVLAVIKDLIENHLPRFGYDPIKDLQVLTPMNKGPLGAVTLNNEIQSYLNPLERHHNVFKKKNYQIRSKDKVIQSMNNYELGIFNGDIGFVKHVKTKEADVVADFSDKIVSFQQDQAQDLNLAYAITIHKSQGSEFPVVILPIHMAHYVMLQRNLIYTGLTRAKKLAIFIGEKRALRQAVLNQASLTRQTNLGQILASN